MCIWILRNEYQMVWFSFVVNVAIVYVNTQSSEDKIYFLKQVQLKWFLWQLSPWWYSLNLGTHGQKKSFLFVGYVTQYICWWCDMLIFSLLLGIWKIKFWFASLYLFTCGSEKTYAKEKYVGSFFNIYLIKKSCIPKFQAFS